MNRRWIRISGTFVLALALAACGGGGTEEGEEGERGGTEACEGTLVAAAELKLPSDFPTPDGVTFTESGMVGPSGVADGYFEGDLRDAYDAWKAAFADADYTILFDEIEDHDSEISYRSADETSTGQVALRDECEESGRIFVHVTDRPA